jgi:hypothetical protein
MPLPQIDGPRIGQKRRIHGGNMPEVMNKKVVAIDYPLHNETITSNDYTFRVTAMPGVKKVEISINGGGWEPCRQSENAFWYDWSGYVSGDHEMIARVQLPSGHHYNTEHRFFSVELDPQRQNDERRSSSHRRTPQPQAHGRTELHKHMSHKYVVVVPNQPGVLRHLTQLLSQEGVNIDSLLTETFGDVASYRFLLEKENGLRRTLEDAGFHVVNDKVFRLDLPNRPGELDQLAQKLSEQGIGIRYLYGTSHGRTTKVILAVDRPEDALAIVKQLDQRLVSVEA